MVLDSFISVKINTFPPFFPLSGMSDVIAIVGNWSRGGGWWTIFGQPMLFECMSICVLSLVYECEMRGSLVYLVTAHYLIHRHCSNSATVHYTGSVVEFLEEKKKKKKEDEEKRS